MKTFTKKVDQGLATPIQYIKGIGPKRAEALRASGILTVYNLLYYFPRSYLDLSKVEAIGSLAAFMNTGTWVSAIGTVRSFETVGRPPHQRFTLILGDEGGSIQLVFFQNAKFFSKAFTIGETLAVSGRVTGFRNRPQFVHPNIDRITSNKEADETMKERVHTSGLMPQYSSNEELRRVHLDSKGMRKIMMAAVEGHVHEIVEHIPPEVIEAEKLSPLIDAIKNAHFPESQKQLDVARNRLKFDELFAFQLLLALRRKSVKVEAKGIAFNIKSARARKLVEALPFALTAAQKKVIKQITDDMNASKPMNRLLQGDVGSGKTIVALLAMLVAVDNGYQAAFMAPTEILAEQHVQTLASFLAPLDVKVRLLVSGQKKKLRDDILEDIRRGTANIVVGTHALIQEGVEFANLGLAVIDEQHRFGVMQRAILKSKATRKDPDAPVPDVLVMTATPIPRSLALTMYGDLDVSTITELPKSRKPVRTVVRIESKRGSVYDFVRTEIKEGRQAYIVYPLVEESENFDLKAAVESYELLRTEMFPTLRLGLLHGRLDQGEKDAVMTAFKSRKIDILVSTTVIEVGIDVPNASVMLIEHADRFGLPQLHQLRGRVGRGADQSYCILMTPDWMGRRVRKTITPTEERSEDERDAERRLSAMVATTDGFKIAEIDLELRGPGDFFGTKQSGLPTLHVANLITDGEILTRARREAFALVERDPELSEPEHRPLMKHMGDRLHDALALMQVG